MAIRIPKMVPGATFNVRTVASGASIISTERIKPVKGVLKIDRSDSSKPDGSEAFVIKARYYDEFASPEIQEIESEYRFVPQQSVNPWDAGTSYVVNNKVEHNGKYYWATAGSTGIAPDADPEAFSPDLTEIPWSPRTVLTGSGVTFNDVFESLITSIKENDSIAVEIWTLGSDIYLRAADASDLNASDTWIQFHSLVNPSGAIGSGSLVVDIEQGEPLDISPGPEYGSPARVYAVGGHEGAKTFDGGEFSFRMSAPLWNAKITYAQNDVVTWDGEFWEATVAPTAGVEPGDSSPAEWRLYGAGSPIDTGLFTVTLGTFATTDGITAVSSAIRMSLNSQFPPSSGNFWDVHFDISEVGSNTRWEVVNQHVGTGYTLEIVTPNDIWEVGAIADGVSAGHPSSDEATTKNFIALQTPEDPAYFRYYNRSVIDLADNDKSIYKEFIALRDGYNIDTGDPVNQTFTGAGGVTIDTDLVVTGQLILQNPDPIQQNVVHLNVSDRVITLNDGESGSGITVGGSPSFGGIQIDRGTLPDASLYFNEGFMDPDDPTNVFPAWTIFPTKIASTLDIFGTVVESEQISIGDGVLTQGTYTIGKNAASFDQAIQLAMTALPTGGGRIFIKRGAYSTNGVNVTDDGIMFEGEGHSTAITCADSFTVNGDNTTVTNLRLINNNGSNPALDLPSGSPQRCIIEKVYFEELTPSTDITFDQFDDHVVSNCISTTTTTNLP